MSGPLGEPVAGDVNDIKRFPADVVVDLLEEHDILRPGNEPLTRWEPSAEEAPASTNSPARK